METNISKYFTFRNKQLHCEDVSINEIKAFLQDQDFKTVSPVFVISKNQICDNVNAYLNALKKLKRPFVLNYAMKANMNPAVLRLMRDLGCSVTLVSGNELQLALSLGFEPGRMLLNGNGKQAWEIELAVRHGCLLNVDGVFNLQQTADVCRRLDRKARLLLRVNPELVVDTVVTSNSLNIL